ncbi:GIY-YIG nuclease family protein [Flavobacteriaceae bacterium TK19130]|nr:GIY-YIG nuclease family protein [Thermobacterium salinum]
MYAILDIETTGGKYNEEGITEIAIYRFDGHEIVDQFSSLVNPERPIQPFVVNLTGINNEMLRNAPKFYEVAKRIVEITRDCVVVAHNAKFDNRILTTEFDRLGYQFERDSLCTVELSKKLIPGLPSYSLGKLVKNLGIPLSNRHRAQGDAKATVSLFKLLLSKDTDKEIVKKSVRKDPKRQLEPKLLDMIEKAPNETGVYYMHNSEGDIIYIGKSKNIKKRLTQHFTSEARKAKQMQVEVASVSYEKTGTDLVAQLKESEEIKRNKPPYNRALRKTLFNYQLTHFTDDNGYINLKIERADKRKRALTTFTSMRQAKNVMTQVTDQYQLCQKLTSLHNTQNNCFHYTIKECHGACLGEEPVEDYNERVREFIDARSYENKDMLIIDRGREVTERSVIWIENGKYRGYGFYDLNFQINRPEILKSIITPMPDDRDAQHIIQSYLRKNKVIRIVNLKANPIN